MPEYVRRIDSNSSLSIPKYGVINIGDILPINVLDNATYIARHFTPSDATEYEAFKTKQK